MIEFSPLTLTTRKTLRLTIRVHALQCEDAPDDYQIFYADTQAELAKMLIDHFVDKEKVDVDYFFGKEAEKRGIHRVSFYLAQVDIIIIDGVEYDWKVAKACGEIEKGELVNYSSDIAIHGCDAEISEKDFVNNEVLSSKYLLMKRQEQRDKHKAEKGVKGKEAEERRRVKYEKLKKEFEPEKKGNEKEA